MEYEIEYFKLNNEKRPFIDWFQKLDTVMKKRITQRILRIKEGNFGDFKKIDNELNELRFNFGKGYRVYYTQQNNKIIILLSGGDKSNQENDIKKAKEYIKILKGNN